MVGLSNAPYISFPNLQIRPIYSKNQEVCFRLLPFATVILPGYKDCEHNGCNRSLGYGTDDDEPEWETDSDGDEWLGSDGGLGLPFAERGLGIKGVPMSVKTLEAHHRGPLEGADKTAAFEFFAKSESGGRVVASGGWFVPKVNTCVWAVFVELLQMF